MPIPNALPPPPHNEPVCSYQPGSAARANLKRALAEMSRNEVHVPMWIGGRAISTENTAPIRSPHAHDLRLGTFSQGDRSSTEKAISAAEAARPEWSALTQSARSAIFLRAAELAATTHRDRLNASTMLGQSKTAIQAEIDSACEFIDFLRFNCAWAQRLVEQPASAPNMWNALEPRPLDGFVVAISPFNFTAIAGNLPSAPALVGNTVVWKPSPLAMRSAHEIMDLFRAAGLPDGVINMVTGPAEEVVETCLDHPSLAGVHFTGSTAVFRSIWGRVGQSIGRYRAYPRLVGETGGKDFVFAHASADLDRLVVALVRGAFEYQGQKCSAASRAYIPKSLWPRLRPRLIESIEGLSMGPVDDFKNFMGAVIGEASFTRLSQAIDRAKATPGHQVLAGGVCDKTSGWFVRPTLIETTDATSFTLREEFFGPLLGLIVYDDANVDEALTACDLGSDYALTGAVFADDRRFIEHASKALRGAAGNFYINDKPTGAVVGQQPFGGGRASGTNDKAGSPLNLLRWISPRTVKETFSAPTVIGYPHMESD